MVIVQTQGPHNLAIVGLQINRKEGLYHILRHAQYLISQKSVLWVLNELKDKYFQLGNNNIVHQTDYALGSITGI